MARKHMQPRPPWTLCILWRFAGGSTMWSANRICLACQEHGLDRTNGTAARQPEPLAPLWGGQAFGFGRRSWDTLKAANSAEGSRVQGSEIPIGVHPVLPLLVEDDPQAVTHRVAARRRPSGRVDRFGVAVERLVGQALDHL